MENCHGCRFLDEIRGKNGEGYCCHVERAPEYNPGMKCRYPDMERCSLFEPGKRGDQFK